MACHSSLEASSFPWNDAPLWQRYYSDEEGIAGKHTSCPSYWDCCGRASLWAALLACWAEPRVSLNPFFMLQVRPVPPALSSALFLACLALSVFILGSRERRESSSTYRPQGSPLDCPQPHTPFSQSPSCRVMQGRS